MSTSSELLYHPARAFYTLVTIHGKLHLVIRRGRKWEIDDAYHSINELLDYGLVNDEAVLMWIAKNPAPD